MLPRSELPRSFAEVIDIQLLKKWWILVCSGAVAAGLLAVGYCAFIPPSYEADVRVIVQNNGLGIEGAGDKPVYDKEFLSTQAEIIRSPATISRSLSDLPPARADKIEVDDDPVSLISENLRVNLLAGTDIVRLTFTHSDPEYAVARLRSIVKSYQNHVRSTEQSSASQAVELLTEREAELAAQLRELQQQLLSGRTTAKHRVAGETANESPLLKELTDRWVDVEAELVSVESALQAWRDGSTPPESVSHVDSREVTALENELFDARAELESMLIVLGPAHPLRMGAKRRVAVLESEVSLRRQRMRSDLVRTLQQLKTENRSLMKMMVEENERLTQAGTIRIQEERLQSEISHLAEIHQSTIAALESVQLADRTLSGGRSSILVDVIDDFTVPQMPVWPRPKPLIAISVMLGALAGLAIAVFVESRQRFLAAAVAPGNLSDGIHPTDPTLQDDQQLRPASVSHVRPVAKSPPLVTPGAGHGTV